MASDRRRRRQHTEIPAQGRTGYEHFFVLFGILFLAGVVGIAAELWLQVPFSLLPALSRLLLLLGVLGWITVEGTSRPPVNGPSQYVTAARSSSPCLVCLGDSLTHGRCSDNWVDRIATDERISQAALQVVNAGQNMICTHTVLQERVHHVQACEPNFVLVLIGSNDMLGIYRDDWARDKVKDWNLPAKPTFDLFEHNLDGIINYLVSNTKATIALCTLPPFGEDLASRANDIIRKANATVHKIGAKYIKRVQVLDLHEKLKAEIVARRHRIDRKVYPFDAWILPAQIMALCHQVFGISWNALSRVIGNTVMSDCVHLNKEGGDAVANLVVEWLFRLCSQSPIGSSVKDAYPHLEWLLHTLSNATVVDSSGSPSY